MRHGLSQGRGGAAVAVVEPRGRQAAARKVAAQLEAATAELAAAVRRQAAVAVALLDFGLILMMIGLLGRFGSGLRGGAAAVTPDGDDGDGLGGVGGGEVSPAVDLLGGGGGAVVGLRGRRER